MTPQALKAHAYDALQARQRLLERRKAGDRSHTGLVRIKQATEAALAAENKLAREGARD